MKKDFIILTVQDGVIQQSKKLHEFLTLSDGRYILEKSAYNKRSLPQNRFYFGICIPMIQQGIKDMGTELTKEETHEFLKAKFNGSDLINQETGEAINIPLSTTRLSKGEFSEYIAKIQQFASEFLSIVIPDPNQQMEIYQ